jgi:SAM-dependent methyltransferase
VRHASLSNPTKITRALDVGCAVGGSSFELAKHFDQVVGFDFSSSFVGAANAMKCGQDVDFTIPIEGDFKVQVRASHEPGVDEGVRSRTSFHTGDACQLLARFQDQDPLLLMGITPNDDDCDDAGFDGVVVANLLCRLPQPRLFLDGLSAVLKPGGVAVVVTPYSWLDEFTPREEWLGGTVDQTTGLPVAAKDVLTREMAERGLVKIDEEQLPLVIREHQRKFQYIISEATVWRKEAASTK